jgi:hypothetical protein
MVSVYDDSDLLSVYKQKQKIFYVFLGVTIFYVLFCVGWLVYHILLPYASEKATLPKVLVYVFSVLYSCFLFPFMGIKYSRVRKYYKMLTYVGEGLKMEEKNYFYSFREKSLQKDNIDVVGCVFETWSKKKGEWMEREAYWDPEKPMPPFESGDYVRYITQSNFIVQYEIVQKKALEFEEEEYEEECEEETDAQEVAQTIENEDKGEEQ